MPNFIKLPAFTDDGDVYVVVETPLGSRAKFAYDPSLRLSPSPNRSLSD
jgi:inorganic pyrophosphatase